MALDGIPAFSIHTSTMAVRVRPKLLSEQEFAVVVFAASGISPHSRSAAKARITAVVEWSAKGKKSIVHQDRLDCKHI